MSFHELHLSLNSKWFDCPNEICDGSGASDGYAFGGLSSSPPGSIMRSRFKYSGYLTKEKGTIAQMVKAADSELPGLNPADAMLKQPSWIAMMAEWQPINKSSL